MLAKDFISSLIVRDPRNRLTAAKCLEHPWLNLVKLQCCTNLSSTRKYKPKVHFKCRKVCKSTINKEKSIWDNSLTQDLVLELLI